MFSIPQTPTIPATVIGAQIITEVSSQILWTLSGSSQDWEGGLQTGITSFNTDSSSVPCVSA